MNEENLIPNYHELTSADRSKGGRKRAEIVRRRKAMKEQFEMLLSLPSKNKSLIETARMMGISKSEVDNGMALILSMYREALKGNISAFTVIRDTIGERPVEVIKNVEQPTIVFERPANDSKCL